MTIESLSSIIGGKPQNGIHSAFTAPAANNFHSYLSTPDHPIGVEKSIMIKGFVKVMAPHFKPGMFIHAQICHQNTANAAVPPTVPVTTPTD